MNVCPSSELLASLLAEELDPQTAERLVDHVGDCPTCRATLLSLSEDLDDWQSWESMLQAPQVSWPTWASGEGNSSERADTDQPPVNAAQGKSRVPDTSRVRRHIRVSSWRRGDAQSRLAC